MHKAIAIIVSTVTVGLLALRCQDEVNTLRTWRSVSQVARTGPRETVRFDRDTIAHLPETARRYFAFTLSDGARITPGARIAMTGTLTLGDGPDAMPLAKEADQILVPPHGFVWSVEARSGWFTVAGSDIQHGDVSWSRFWSVGLLPVARAGRTQDHWRASFGRLMAEAAIWLPASLLPAEGIEWSQPGDDVARVSISHGSVVQAVEIYLRDDGAPLRVEIDRWSDANPDREFRLQRFDGYLDDFRTVDGITVPMQVVGGNFIGTPDYAPFYRAEVTKIEFLEPTDDTD